MKPESYTELDKLVSILKKNPTPIILITGHTDGVGKDSDNLVLSEQRAKSVVNYLISKGISEKRIGYKGFGETQPIATNNTNEGRAENRRVEFEVVEK